MAASLVTLGLLVVGAPARAQDTPSSPAQPESKQVLHFVKPAAPMPAYKPAMSAPGSTNIDYSLRPVGFQQNVKDSGKTPTPGEGAEYTIQLEPPGPQQVFRLESETSLQERMRQEGRQRPTPERIQFPDEPLVGKGAYLTRGFTPKQMVVEPNYLCYHRLYFERLNSERYGWDLGFIQPVVSTAGFYWDLAFLPYHMWTDPCRNYDSNAGYCLPGDPVPLLLYPPQLSVTGALGEAVTVVGIVFAFP
jgi:hypothetical protein